MEVYRFTRALFRLISSPFLLGGVISEHLNKWEATYPEIVKELRDGFYVDDLLIGRATVEEVQIKKQTAIEIFNKAIFTLHKWHSNAEELESNKDYPQDHHDEGVCTAICAVTKQESGTTQRLVCAKSRNWLPVIWP